MKVFIDKNLDFYKISYFSCQQTITEYFLEFLTVQTVRNSLFCLRFKGYYIDIIEVIKHYHVCFLI